MSSNEHYRHHAERFDHIRLVHEALAEHGYYFQAVEREHAEAGATGPLVHRLRGLIEDKGFANVVSRVGITFSGYADDPREVFAIPELRRYWRELDAQLPELPALLAVLPDLGFNGPGMHLTLLGTIDTVVPRSHSYDVQIADAPRIIDDALQRIQQAGAKYWAPSTLVHQIVDQFNRGAHYRLH